MPHRDTSELDDDLIATDDEVCERVRDDCKALMDCNVIMSWDGQVRS